MSTADTLLTKYHPGGLQCNTHAHTETRRHASHTHTLQSSCRKRSISGPAPFCIDPGREWRSRTSFAARFHFTLQDAQISSPFTSAERRDERRRPFSPNPAFPTPAEKETRADVWGSAWPPLRVIDGWGAETEGMKGRDGKEGGGRNAQRGTFADLIFMEVFKGREKDHPKTNLSAGVFTCTS